MTIAATVRRSTLALALLALVASLAFAGHPIGVDAADMPTRDKDKKPVDEVGVDLSCNGGFAVVFTAEDAGSLGNVLTDGYTYDELAKDAMKRVIPDAAVQRLGVLTEEPHGLRIVVDDVPRHELMALTADALAASGCTVAEQLEQGFGFTFVDAHGTTRVATFSTAEEGAAVYIGH